MFLKRRVEMCLLLLMTEVEGTESATTNILYSRSPKYQNRNSRMNSLKSTQLIILYCRSVVYFHLGSGTGRKSTGSDGTDRRRVSGGKTRSPGVVLQ